MGCVATSGVAVSEPPEKVAPLEAPISSQNFHKNYLLEDKLGEGCFAVVYACRRTEGGPEAEFAVKITDIRRHKVEHPDRTCERAEQEARVLRSLGNQPHCCRFVESMSCKRFHYLVMEKYSTTLLHALKSMPELTERSLSGVVHQMFRGVGALHALGMVHRDVKPDNFLCEGPDATVKLCDFGFAQRVPRSGSSGLKGIYGTAPFMSPEMILSAHGMPTDVWSLGVVMYTFLLGEFPYIPEKPSRELMRLAIASGVPEPAYAPRRPAAGTQMSEEALELTKALLNRNPEKRPSINDALRHGWFRFGATAADRELCCLRPAIQSAERMGAFGNSSAGGTSGSTKVSNAARTLHELQRKYRSSDGDQDEVSYASSSKSSSPRGSSSPSKRTCSKGSKGSKGSKEERLYFSGDFDGHDGHRFGVLIAT